VKACGTPSLEPSLVSLGPTPTLREEIDLKLGEKKEQALKPTGMRKVRCPHMGKEETERTRDLIT